MRRALEVVVVPARPVARWRRTLARVLLRAAAALVRMRLRVVDEDPRI